jgi:hypothetical protein
MFYFWKFFIWQFYFWTNSFCSQVPTRCPWPCGLPRPRRCAVKCTPLPPRTYVRTSVRLPSGARRPAVAGRRPGTPFPGPPQPLAGWLHCRIPVPCAFSVPPDTAYACPSLSASGSCLAVRRGYTRGRVGLRFWCLTLAPLTALYPPPLFPHLYLPHLQLPCLAVPLHLQRVWLPEPHLPPPQHVRYYPSHCPLIMRVYLYPIPYIHLIAPVHRCPLLVCLRHFLCPPCSRG